MELIIKGYLGDFIRLFPWIILTALMTSLFYAVSVVPTLEVRYIGTGAERNNLFARMQEKFFTGLQKFYEWCLERCFRHPAITLTGGLCAIGLGILMFSQLNIQMLPKAARDFFVIELYVDAGNGIEVTRARTDSLSGILLGDNRVKSVTSFVGTGAPRFAATYTPILPSPQTAQIIVNTTSNKATEDILREYPGRYEHLFPDALLRFKQMDYQPVEAPVEIHFICDRREDATEAAAKVAAYLRSLTGETQWVHNDLDNFAPSVEICLDGDEASRLGVSKALVSLSLAGTFGGETVATLWEGDRQVPVCLYSEGIGGDMPYETIGGQLVPTLIPGVNVPLRQVASVVPGWQPEKLRRYAGRSVVTVGCDLKTGVSQPDVQKQLEKFVREEVEPELPDGVEYSFLGLSAANDMVFPNIAWSFLAACLVLFLFLVLHFRKVSVAVLTMVLSSLCLFGASFGLWIFGQDFSITAVLGLVSLIGIIVRNGILMFEYAEERRRDGESVKEAALLSGKRRMRPIFLTSCTTALGVLPMIISGDLLWMPMGITICFGTMLSIFLITLIMPVSYWQIFKKADRK
jgi:multidrug efflux pump subunit AcrB